MSLKKETTCGGGWSCYQYLHLSLSLCISLAHSLVRYQRDHVALLGQHQVTDIGSFLWQSYVKAECVVSSLRPYCCPVAI